MTDEQTSLEFISLSNAVDEIGLSILKNLNEF